MMLLEYDTDKVKPKKGDSVLSFEKQSGVGTLTTRRQGTFLRLLYFSEGGIALKGMVMFCSLRLLCV
jgi:hypothetical protein